MQCSNPECIYTHWLRTPYLYQSLLHGSPIGNPPCTFEHEIRVQVAFRLGIFCQWLPLVQFLRTAGSETGDVKSFSNLRIMFLNVPLLWSLELKSLPNPVVFPELVLRENGWRDIGSLMFFSSLLHRFLIGFLGLNMTCELFRTSDGDNKMMTSEAALSQYNLFVLTDMSLTK